MRGLRHLGVTYDKAIKKYSSDIRGDKGIISAVEFSGKQSRYPKQSLCKAQIGNAWWKGSFH
jgi:hypothetical protein